MPRLMTSTGVVVFLFALVRAIWNMDPTLFVFALLIGAFVLFVWIILPPMLASSKDDDVLTAYTDSRRDGPTPGV